MPPATLALTLPCTAGCGSEYLGIVPLTLDLPTYAGAKPYVESEGARYMYVGTYVCMYVVIVFLDRSIPP